MKAMILQILRLPEAFLVAFLILLFVMINQLDPSFLGWEVQQGLSTHVWELAIIAIPMTLIILTSGIDLSVGSIMSLSAITTGMLFQAGCPISVACCAALFVGTLSGFLNGIFISRMKVHPLIITLATMATYRGIAEGISQAKPVSGFPEGFTRLGQEQWQNLPVGGWVFVMLLILILWIVHKRTFGVHIYAIGNNEIASRFSGVQVDRILISLYTFSGFCSALAAILFIARRNTAKADIGMGIELGVITAVVIGGVSIFGGRGTLMGTCLGVLLIHQTREFVSWHWNRDELILIVLGALLIVSVVFQKFLRHKQSSS